MNVVLVCGSRHLVIESFVFRTLDEIHEEKPIDAVVHGGCSGADSLANKWAFDRGLPVIGVPANWSSYGKRAGPLRNGWMLKFVRVNLVVAFPGGSGTANMVSQARDAGVEVREIRK